MSDTITLPPEERQRLAEAFAIAQETGIKTIDFAAQRLKAVLIIGHTLNHWKAKLTAEGYGTWYQWLDQNIKPLADVTSRSLTNWMQLARMEESGKLKIEAGQGVRKAMQQAGIIPPNDVSAVSEGKVRGTPAIILAIVRVAHQAGRIVPDTLDEHQCVTLSAALAALVSLHSRIAARRLSLSPTAPRHNQGSRQQEA